MRKTITIKGKYLEFEDEDNKKHKLNLNDYLVTFENKHPILGGIYSADYLLEQFYDLQGIPSKFSLARKLAKFEKKTAISHKFQIH
jgi:hypothetical protein